MSKPYIHALSSAKKYGGSVVDYLAIHEVMDGSKSITASNEHRLFTHQAWFISYILPKIFGETFVNSDGKTISTRDIGEQHCLEDYHGYIPSATDFLELLNHAEWIHGNGTPPSAAKLIHKTIKRVIKYD